MTNLLEETLEAIATSGHTASDIYFIGSADGKYGISWARFQEVANQEYHSGYGSAEVATDLVVAFSDGMKMWRTEYDGSEGWEYDAPSAVKFDPTVDNITELVGGLWPSVEALHDPETPEAYKMKSVDSDR